MSLMNDALRKKNRETKQGRSAAGFSEAVRLPRPTRRWVFLLAAVFLLTGAALGGIHLMQSDAADAVLLKPPLHHRFGMETARTAGPSSMVQRPENTDTEPIPTGGGPTIPVTDEMAATDGIANGHGFSAPAFSKTKAKPSDNRLQIAVTTAKTCEAKRAPATFTHGPATTDAPVNPIRGQSASVSCAFEPGPDETARRNPRPSPTPRHAPPPAEVAPLPREPIGEPDAGQTPKQAVKSDPDKDLFYQKARSYHRNGRLTDAMRLYRQVLDTSPGHPEAMLNLAAAAIQQGSYIDAQPLLEQLERSRQRPQGVLLNLAIVSIGKGAPKQALTYLDRAAATSDASPWEIRFHRAVALARMNRLAEALVLYQAAEAEQPEAPGLQFNLAVTCDALGLYPEALAHYKAVLHAVAEPSEADQVTITQRIRTLGRYLDTTQASEKGSSNG